LRAKGGIEEEIRRGIQETALTPLTTSPGTGETISLRQDQNADCSWDEFKRTETAPELVGEVDIRRYDYDVSTDRKINAPAKEENFTVGPTDILQVTNDENPDGTWNTSRSVTTPKKQELGAVYFSEGRAVDLRIFRNWTASEIEAYVAAISQDKSVNVTAVPNEFGLNDGSVTVTDAFGAASGSAGAETPKTVEYYVDIGGDRYTYTSKLTSFETTARNHVQGSSDFTEAQWGRVSPKPGFSYVGKGRYLAWRVVVS
jgi:hypothetical protein